MFIAHLPAGYLLACSSERLVTPTHRRLAFWCLVAGSILPDLDMFYFYLIDARQTHHHLYWPHLPVFWLVLLGVAFGLAAVLRRSRVARASLCMAAGVLLHLLLDTPVGGIAWGYPLSKNLIHWVVVPAVRSWWVWNFILHWTFLLEIAICIAAGVVWFRRRRNARVHAAD